MGEHDVSVEVRAIALVLTNGARLAGEMFLPLYGVHQERTQRVGEALNNGDDFLPLRTAEGTRLVNLEQIVAVSVAAATEFDPILALGREHRVRVTTLAGDPLDTQIFVNLPSCNNRVKDFLGQKKQFLPFNREEEVVYIARDKILFVED